MLAVPVCRGGGTLRRSHVGLMVLRFSAGILWRFFFVVLMYLKEPVAMYCGSAIFR